MFIEKSLPTVSCSWRELHTGSHYLKFPAWHSQELEDAKHSVLDYHDKVILVGRNGHYSQVELPEPYQGFA